MAIHDPYDTESESPEPEARDEAASGPRRRRYRRSPGARKERVLHTRISDQLADDIGRMADELRVPVSNLVRNVLEETFTVVETVTDNVGDLVEDVVEEAERARDRIRGRRRRHSWRRARAAEAEEPPESPEERREYPDVVGWQPLILNQPQDCSDCGVPIAVGQRAFVGLTREGLAPQALCGECVEARR